jgi:hypothetical protein
LFWATKLHVLFIANDQDRLPTPLEPRFPHRLLLCRLVEVDPDGS